MLGGYESLMQGGGIPSLYIWVSAIAWAAGALAIGFSIVCIIVASLSCSRPVRASPRSASAGKVAVPPA